MHRSIALHLALLGALTACESKKPAPASTSSTGSPSAEPPAAASSAPSAGSSAPAAGSSAPAAVTPPSPVGSWHALTTLPAGGDSPHVIALSDSRFLVVSRDANLHTYSGLYDLAKHSWTEVTGKVDYEAALALTPRGVVATGGHALEGDRTVVRLDEAAHRWVAAPDMKQARTGHSAASLAGGDALVIGGYAKGYLASVERFDNKTAAWRAAAPLATARSEHTTCVLRDGRVLVSGGDGNNGEAGKLEVTVSAGGSEHAAVKQGSLGATGSAELYDPATDRWQTLPPLKIPRRHHVCVALSDGGALLIGGLHGNGTMPVAEVERWNPTTGFTEVGSLPQPRRAAAGALLADGRVLVTGGGGDDVSATVQTAIFDPATDTWSPGPDMHDARQDHAVAVVGGHVLVIGGRSDSQQPVLTIEELAP